LSKELRAKHGARSMPVRKDDEVTIVRGKNKWHSGKVTDVYRKRWCLYLDGLAKSKQNGQPIRVPIDASNCVVTKIKMTKDRQNLLVRKASNNDKLKGKGVASE
jgi:large subunit ribosomal protein L26e